MKIQNQDAVEEIKKSVKIRFRHTDLKHEAIRELANLYYQHELSKERQEPQDHPLQEALHEMNLADDGKDEIVDLHSLLQNQIKLPSLPTIFSQIIDLMSNPNSGANDFADVIKQDPALTAKLLKIVNSAFYGYRSKVDTISNAVMIIGTSELYALCLSTSVLTMFKDIPTSLVNMSSFWKHSIGCGIIAKKIAVYKKETNRERFFVAGLLHDIGRLVIYEYLTNQAHKAIALSKKDNELLYKSENKILGFDHAKIGGRLLKKWKLPSKLDDIIQFHHNPETSPEHSDSAIIHISDIITNAVRFGSSGEQLVPSLDPVAWKTVGLPVSMLAEIVNEAEAHISELSSILIPEKIN